MFWCITPISSCNASDGNQAGIMTYTHKAVELMIEVENNDVVILVARDRKTTVEHQVIFGLCDLHYSVLKYQENVIQLLLVLNLGYHRQVRKYSTYIDINRPKPCRPRRTGAMYICLYLVSGMTSSAHI